MPNSGKGSNVLDMSSSWQEQFDAALNKTLLQSDQKAVFKLPDVQRLAVIKALTPIMERIIKEKS